MTRNMTHYLTSLICLLCLSFFPVWLVAANTDQDVAAELDEFLPPTREKALTHQSADGAFSVPASVISLQDAMLSAEIAANVEKINVDVGDSVKKGQALARMDCREFTIREEQAQADLDTLKARILTIRARIVSAKNEFMVSESNINLRRHQTQTAHDNTAIAQAELSRVKAQSKATQAQCHLALLEAKRARKLYQRRVISEQELDKTDAVLHAEQANCNAIQPHIRSAVAKLDAMKSGVSSAQVAVSVQHAKARVSHSNINIIEAEIPALNAQIDAATAKLKTEQLMVSRCRLHAPFSGEIVKRFMQIGQRIGIGEDAFQIISTSDKEIIASLSDQELTALTKAKSIHFQLPDTRFAIKFRAAVPVVSGEALTREVRFTFNQKNSLPIGKTGRVIWEIQ